MARRTTDLVAEFHHPATAAEDRFRCARVTDQAGILGLQTAERPEGGQVARQRPHDHFAVPLVTLRERAVRLVEVDRPDEVAARTSAPRGRHRYAQRVAEASQALRQGSGYSPGRPDTATALQDLLGQLLAQRHIDLFL